MKYNTLKITTLQSNKHTKQTNKPTHLPVLPQKNMTTKPFIQTIILNSGPKNAIEDAAAASIRRKTGSKILTIFPTMLFLEDWNLAGFESTNKRYCLNVVKRLYCLQSLSKSWIDVGYCLDRILDRSCKR